MKIGQMLALFAVGVSVALAIPAHGQSALLSLPSSDSDNLSGSAVLPASPVVPAGGPDLRASDGEDEASQLFLRCLRAVFHPRCGLCRRT